MSWTSTDWKYTDGDYAPIPIITVSLYEFNIDDVFLSWLFIDGNAAPIPTLSEDMYEFNIDDVWILWNFTYDTSHIPCSIETITPAGAFTGLDTLTTVTIPPSVKKISMWAFYGTSLTEVTIASDCEYWESSFPEGCTVNFYNQED